MSGNAQKHHHEWGTYFIIVNILAALTVFAWILSACIPLRRFD